MPAVRLNAWAVPHGGLPRGHNRTTQVVVAAAGTATAQSLPSVTIPVKSDNTPRWLFTADKALSLTTTTKIGQVIGHFAACSLSDLKPLWQVDQAIADVDVEEGNGGVSWCGPPPTVMSR